MADVKWIKITTDIFDDEKMLLIESLPDANAIIVVWFKLLCLAGKMNNSGVFMMNDKIAYTDKMLSTIFRMKESTVQLALETFQQFGMIELIDGVITIPNWEKHQSLDAYEQKKERDRIYQAERRKKQKLLVTKSSDKSSDSKTIESSYVEKNRFIEEDKEEDKENLIVSKDTIRGTDIQRVIDSWNSLGLSKIKKLVEGTDRYNWLRKRIKDYGIDEVLRAIENVRASDFLQNANFFSFDWMIRPNNFPKVLDGNYDNRTRTENVPSHIKKNNKFNNFNQRTYDFDELEKELISNPDNYI